MMTKISRLKHTYILKDLDTGNIEQLQTVLQYPSFIFIIVQINRLMYYSLFYNCIIQ